MNKELDPVLHQPIRMQIIAYLIASGACDYTTLKNKFDLTDGHMTTHMRELLEHKYVTVEKKFINNKPRTTYYIAPEGQQAFSAYITTLKSILLLD